MIAFNAPVKVKNYKQFALNPTTFEQLKLQRGFVDKTLFIKDIIYGGNNIVITRPRRWGKSLNMRMLRTFFSAGANVDVNGNFNFDI